MPFVMKEPAIDSSATRSSGLGLATILELCKSGAYAAVVDVQDIPEELQRDLGTKARYFKADLTQDEDVRRVARLANEWSKETGAKLGGVVNCAGVGTAQKVRESIFDYWKC